MIIKEQVYITPFDDERTIHIYLPDDLSEDERLDVIYMFDGHNLFDDNEATYGISWGLQETFDQRAVRAMVVGIECNHIGNMRLYEFSPYDFFDADFGEIKGFGKDLFIWLIEELKPYIDETYPTIPFREHTAIGGSSMGGLMALYGIIAHNMIFSKAIIVSPHIFYVLDDILKDIDSHELAYDSSLYISYGADELSSKSGLELYTSQILCLQRALDSRCHLKIHMFVGHDHSEASWREEVPYWLEDLGF